MTMAFRARVAKTQPTIEARIRDPAIAAKLARRRHCTGLQCRASLAGRRGGTSLDPRQNMLFSKKFQAQENRWTDRTAAHGYANRLRHLAQRQRLGLTIS